MASMGTIKVLWRLFLVLIFWVSWGSLPFLDSQRQRQWTSHTNSPFWEWLEHSLSRLDSKSLVSACRMVFTIEFSKYLSSPCCPRPGAKLKLWAGWKMEKYLHLPLALGAGVDWWLPAGKQGEPGCEEKPWPSARSGFGTSQVLGFVSHYSSQVPSVTSQTAWKENNSTLPSPDQRQKEEERWDVDGYGLKSSRTCGPGVRQTMD